MQFSNPLALILILLLPVAAAIGWPARGPAKRREVISLGLRLLLLILLIFSLAGLELGRLSNDLAVVFLLDVSDSMGEDARTAAQNYLQQAMQTMGPDDQAALVVFGAEALVERSLSSNRDFSGITSIPQTQATDLAEAIRLGLALFPAGTARRMVLLSDGAVTTGDTTSALALAAASGVHLVAVPLASVPGPEILLSDVRVPGHLHQGERFDLRLTVESTQAVQAQVRILSGGTILYQGPQTIQRGIQTFSLPLAAGEPGFTRYEVQIEAAEDGRYQNNSLATFSQVEGPPTVLLVAPPAGELLFSSGEKRPDEASQLREALESAGISIQTTDPVRLPSDLVELAPYSAVILVDTPARDLNQRQMEALQSYVRDLGGGLIAVGGPTSFGVGGYFRTPLEETLPVDMQIKDEKRRPSLAMVFIIDHSGSMADQSGGVNKLELAKEAAIRSVDMLFPNDRVGVIAFDDTAQWVVPMTDLSNPQRVKSAIASLRPGGGTDILAGVQAMAHELPQDPASLKHVILLTDGGADPTGIKELIAQLNRDSQITLTSVGVGTDAASFLPDLAAAGGGRYHFTADPASIPRIFTEETTLATRAYLVEETFYPLRANPSPILSGIRETPPLHGYVGTSLKTVAQPILLSDRGDPILASWQYGLGRAVAFTSDATGRWGRDWVRWQGFTTFWSQAVSFVLRQPSAAPLDIQVESQGDTARLIVNASTEDGGYLNGYDLTANVVGPDGEAQTIPLEQTAPGRYESSFIPGNPGAYLVGVGGTAADESGANEGGVNATSGWVVSYSPEYQTLLNDPAAACQFDAEPAACRQALGQNDMSAFDPDRAFAHNLPAGKAARPAWPWLLGLAALLLPLDIATRRLIVSQKDLQRSWTGLKERVQARRAQPSPAGSSAPSLPVEALRQARQRAAENMEATSTPVQPAAHPPIPTSPNLRPAEPDPAAPPAESAPGATKSPAASYDKKEETSISTASALLAAKRDKSKKK